MATAPAHPIKLLDDFLIVKNVCKDFVKANNNLVVISFPEQYAIEIAERFNKYNFGFKVFNPRFDPGHNTLVAISFIPESEVSNKELTRSIIAKDIAGFLQSWLNLIRGHYMHHPDNMLVDELTESYYKDLIIYDEDADTAFLRIITLHNCC